MRRFIGYPKGPVQMLCEEIGQEFERGMERTDLFVAFVRQLVDEVAERREMAVTLAPHLVSKQGPSEESWVVLEAAYTMLGKSTVADLIAAAAAVHELCWEHNPEDKIPTDHLIDMLSSCASALRFGLESGPCRSRHAASAAQHVWKQRYGVTYFDKHTSAWENAWARHQFIRAMLSLLPPTGDGSQAPVASDGEVQRSGTTEPNPNPRS